MQHYYEEYIFSNNLNEINIIEEGCFLDFNKSDIDFLKKCFASEFYNQCDYSISYYQPPIFYIDLESILLFGNCGGIIINNKLLVESFFSQKKMFKSKAYRSISFFDEKTKDEDVYTSIFHQYSLNNNIFHWYIECLPRLHLLAYINKPVTILCPNNLLEFQIQQIQELASRYTSIKIEFINENAIYKVSNFVFLSFLNNVRSGFLPQFALDYYIDLVEKLPSLTTKKRIFIDRRLNKTRNIVNHQEIELFLKKLGFETICLENLSIEEQMSLFKNAEIVVGVHGAGLTNIIFSNQIKVIELHPNTKINPPYFFLSKSKNLHYVPIICKSVDNNNNIVVDVGLLSRELNKLI